ncbi:MAG: hypothetical protein ACYDHT_11690 [Solirubrobacteraceae bacterium]
MYSDPTDTGGVLVGRRLDAAPVHFRAPPQRGSDTRQPTDGALAGLLLGAIAVFSVFCSGPISRACMAG